MVGPGVLPSTFWVFHKIGIKEEAWSEEARRRGQRREWEDFEVLDSGMKKFPVKLLADWAAAAAAAGLEVAQG